MVGLRGVVMWTYPGRFYLVNVGRTFCCVFFGTMGKTNDFKKKLYSRKKSKIIWHLVLLSWTRGGRIQRPSNTWIWLSSIDIRLAWFVNVFVLPAIARRQIKFHHRSALQIVPPSVGALERQQRWCLKVTSSREMKTFRLVRRLLYASAFDSTRKLLYARTHQHQPSIPGHNRFALILSINCVFISRLVSSYFMFSLRFSCSLQSPVPACSHTAWNWANCVAVMLTVNLD